MNEVYFILNNEYIQCKPTQINGEFIDKYSKHTKAVEPEKIRFNKMNISKTRNYKRDIAKIQL